MSRKVFSFCVYGTHPKYCDGMIKNLEQIKNLYPDFETHIAIGNDVPQEYIDKYTSFEKVKITRYDETGFRLMTYRFFPIDDPSIALMISRDADSRFGDRDVFCIHDFINSEYRLFTIRDHPWHAEPIMGGLWGIKRIDGINMKQSYDEYCSEKEDILYYGSDQHFLAKVLYGIFVISPLFVAYTSRMLYHENRKEIGVHMKDEFDFCGNVYEGDIPQFTIHV